MLNKLLLLLLLSSCGNLLKEKDNGQLACRTREEQRALCYIEEMARLGHDINMNNWVKDYCSRIYVTEGCYTESYH